MVILSPAWPQIDATLWACISEPPASTSSRSRHASMWMWASPASAAMSPRALMVCSEARGRSTARLCYADPRNEDLPVKLTGERPIEGKTPDSLMALHAAGYREVRDRIGPGLFLDLGCGLGDGTAGFAASDRTLVGVDYDATTAAEARRLHLDTGLVTICGDGAKLPLQTGKFDHVCSSHLIE